MRSHIRLPESATWFPEGHVQRDGGGTSAGLYQLLVERSRHYLNAAAVDSRRERKATQSFWDAAPPLIRDDCADRRPQFDEGVPGSYDVHLDARAPDTLTVSLHSGRHGAAPVKGERLLVEVDGQARVSVIARHLCNPQELHTRRRQPRLLSLRVRGVGHGYRLPVRHTRMRRSRLRLRIDSSAHQREVFSVKGWAGAGVSSSVPA